MTSASKKLLGIGLVAVASLAAGCNDFLQVDNPSAVQVDKLADSTQANLLINGAIGQFQSMISNTALWSAVLSDEARSSHVNASYGPIDQRTMSNLNDIIAGVYSPIQRARYAADTVADRLKGYYGANAAKDLRVARMLAMAGYGYTILGETFCKAPINGGASQTPQQLFQAALPRFDEAIAVAKAARAAGDSGARSDSILGLAAVGAARTALDLGDKAKAVAYAQQVPAKFVEFRVYFAEGLPASTTLPVNPYYNGMGSPQPSSATGTNVNGGFSYSSSALWITVDSAFVGINDPRVPMTTLRVSAMNGTPQFVANKPKSFGGYVAPSATQPGGAAMTPGASIRVASAIEAQYILAEANGGAAASTLAFVNLQRTLNGQTPYAGATDAASVLAELRDQRRREFYLDGHRLGDLRRYITQYSIDQFPTGPNFGTVTCYPIPLSELNSNPNAQP